MAGMLGTVSDWYQNSLGRQADQAGLDYWTQQYNANPDAAYAAFDAAAKQERDNRQPVADPFGGSTTYQAPDTSTQPTGMISTAQQPLTQPSYTNTVGQWYADAAKKNNTDPNAYTSGQDYWAGQLASSANPADVQNQFYANYAADAAKQPAQTAQTTPTQTAQPVTTSQPANTSTSFQGPPGYDPAQWYKTYLGRDGDQAGLDFWNNEYKNNPAKAAMDFTKYADIEKERVANQKARETVAQYGQDAQGSLVGMNNSYGWQKLSGLTQQQIQDTGMTAGMDPNFLKANLDPNVLATSANPEAYLKSVAAKYYNTPQYAAMFQAGVDGQAGTQYAALPPPTGGGVRDANGNYLLMDPRLGFMVAYNKYGQRVDVLKDQFSADDMARLKAGKFDAPNFQSVNAQDVIDYKAGNGAYANGGNGFAPVGAAARTAAGANPAGANSTGTGATTGTAGTGLINSAGRPVTSAAPGSTGAGSTGGVGGAGVNTGTGSGGGASYNGTSGVLQVPDENTVLGRFMTTTQQATPLMQMARTSADQQMNARGLLNSSLAISAADQAAYNAALPIANADANLLNNANQFNATQTQDNWRLGQQLDNQYGIAKMGNDTSLQTTAMNNDTSRFNTAANNAASLQQTEMQTVSNQMVTKLNNENQQIMANINANAAQHQQAITAANDLYKQAQLNAQNIRVNNQMSQEAKDQATYAIWQEFNNGVAVLGKTSGVNGIDTILDFSPLKPKTSDTSTSSTSATAANAAAMPGP